MPKNEEKLDMTSLNIVSENIEKIGAIFPNCITETAEGISIDFDMLKQELSDEIVEGRKERYRLEWAGKKEAIVTANLPTTKTLRPIRKDSVDFDNTENVYIEGDNLEVLKILQESYLGKIKMIYIDPPYNTGKDFVYKDNFTKDSDELKLDEGSKDEDNQRLVVNPESSGRYHSDWLSMIYSRLKLSRNLLKDNGVIWVSIDQNEIDNLLKIMDEIYGESNRLAIISNVNNPKGRSDDKYIATAHEFLVYYAKNIDLVTSHGFEPDEKITKRYNKVFGGRKYREIDLRKTGDNDLREDRPNLFYYFHYNEKTGDFYPSRNEKTPNDYISIKPLRADLKEGNWRWQISTVREKSDKLQVKYMPNRKMFGIVEMDFLDERGLVKPTSNWAFKDVNSERGSEAFINLGFDKRVFPKPKPVGTILRCLNVGIGNEKNEIILDFFSGSATTAHSTFLHNITSNNGTKFILVQIPETINNDQYAKSIGYNNICDIGKERIRKASSAIKKEISAEIDFGFRVYRLADSNMKDVYYTPSEYDQTKLDIFADNVKDDRSAEDLLAQIILDWGLPLSLPITSSNIGDKTVWKVAGSSLFACFDSGIDEAFAKQIAKEKPLRIVFKDRSFKDDTAKENVKQLLKQLSPETEMKVV